MRPWPGLVVFILFVPLQIFLAIQLWDHWAWWQTFLFLAALGFLGNRAARVPWLQALIFPHRARAREMRRHVFQGILFLMAAVFFVFAVGPREAWFGLRDGVPLLAVMSAVTLLKAAVR